MEHAYLGFTFDSVLGLHATRAKSVQVLKKSGLILSAQADKLVAYSTNLSQIKQEFNPPAKFKEQHETIQINDVVVSPNEELIAVGYSNAEISVFNVEGEEVNHFTGHRRPITCLAFNSDSNLLASGSQDNDIVIWDVIGDCGICRFSGHQNAITDMCFIPETPWLISASKDTHIRVWDLDINFCIQTVTVAASELYALCLISPIKLVAAGKSSDFFSFIISNPEEVDTKNTIVLTQDVQINRDTKHRVQDIALAPDGKSMAFVTSGENIDVWSILSEEEMEKKRKRRAKRAQKSGGQATEVLQFEKEQTITLPARLCNAEFLGKLIVATLADNSIVVLENVQKEGEEQATFQIKHQTKGHNNDIRGLAFFGESEDEIDKIVSASEGSVRIWDLESKQCIQTIACGTISSIAVLPGGRFFILGTKEGNIEMCDSSQGQVYSTNKCHDGRIWQIIVAPGCTEVATCSSDKEIKFWNIGFKNEQPVLLHKRTLKLPDECYSICYSPDSKYIACALLDSTVRVFEVETLSFHLSLYGSHLPVTFVDYSYDNELIVTASADKNLRIWGTEFGDCHRSLWAHENVVVCSKFIPKTHYAWTCGRDGVLKMWDCDTFRCVQTLRSHIGEIYAMDVSPNGSYVVTGGRDKGIRLWKRTTEKIYLSIEEEKRLEQQIETQNAEKNDRTIQALRGSIFGGAVVDTPGRMTVESIEHGDRLRDDIAAANKEKENPGENPLMRNVSPKDYLLNSMRKINRADMDVVMQSLPFSSAVSFLQWSSEWLEEGKEIELTVRCINSLIKFHERQMESSPEIKDIFVKIRDLVHGKVNEMRSRCGSNLAALKIIQKEIQRPF
ncbi:WD repeat protein, putative [Trichomonas vaginalis G3]|uniref:WD repeat protein, putative n=1 Tax=Trichomonas vaginalis (strain ATCC PRA-98 / G3) TaxID=412133 RepID=A2FME0_TRIV3|nr:WD repeat-containing protein 3 family [Trichomonas vaginalis G3]EAX93915.1 WD repeat protein, putative [Trichomonas vaginalis G3]KAI5523196.1 WD repeat-containing protein 3 family [Trichomonas vaginalis G3]|eukprot:XP_001306845.1 WD repeat protein [Trichomonas vaginalis G3]